MQIIAGALAFGVVVFFAITLYIVFVQNNGQGNAPPQGLPLVSVVAVVLAVMNAPLSLLVPRFMATAALARLAREFLATNAIGDAGRPARPRRCLGWVMKGRVLRHAREYTLAASRSSVPGASPGRR